MTKVTYTPEAAPNDALPDSTTQFGYDFEKGKSVDVTNPAHLRKFAGHPHFEVKGDLPKDNEVVRTATERESAALGAGSQELVTGTPKAAPAVAPVSQPEPGPDKVTPRQADKPDGDSDLRAVHRGRGSFSVMQGDKDEEIIGGLTKEEAETFNNLSAADKAKYLKAHAK